MVRFEVPTEMNMKITLFWDVASCSLVDRYRVSKESIAFIFWVRVPYLPDYTTA
jgi:hypothetical protein